MALALSRTSNEPVPCVLCGASVVGNGAGPAGVLYYLTELGDPVCADCVEAAVVAAIAGVEAGAERYLEGKEKAFWEMRQWQPGRHSGECGCQPCLAGRRIYLAGKFEGERKGELGRMEAQWAKER